MKGRVAPASHVLFDTSFFLHLIEIGKDVAWQTSRAARLLKGAGRHIGDNDCWIAGTALSKGLIVVTRKLKHFARVPGLECAEY